MKMMQLLPYLLIAAGSISTLALFVALKRELAKNTEKQKARIEQMALRLKEAEVAPQRQIAPSEPAVVFVPAPLRAGLNLNKRVHAMRMLRRGEDVAHIAAALGVPRKEVELLIRVQTIGKARVAGSGE